MVRYLFCAIIALLSGCQAVPRAASWPVEPEVSVRWVNDYPMAFTDRGTGPTVVFVHGVLTDYRVWQKPLENWLKDYRVIAVSLRHFYPEIWNGKANDFTYQQHAKDLARFIETLGGPVHLVGWSFGGMPAYMVARDRPDLVRKLVLVEGGPDFRVQADGVPSNADPIKRAAVTEKFFQAGDIDGGLRFAVNDISGPGRWDALSESYRQTIDRRGPMNQRSFWRSSPRRRRGGRGGDRWWERRLRRAFVRGGGGLAALHPGAHQPALLGLVGPGLAEHAVGGRQADAGGQRQLGEFTPRDAAPHGLAQRGIQLVLDLVHRVFSLGPTSAIAFPRPAHRSWGFRSSPVAPAGLLPSSLKVHMTKRPRQSLDGVQFG